jgi:transcriptional regulator with XRE-family HTH domain
VRSLTKNLAAAMSSPALEMYSIRVIVMNPHVLCRQSYGRHAQIVKRNAHTLCLEFAGMDFKKLAGERIRRAREAKNLSRPELAAKIKGLGISTLSNYELGLRYPQPKYLVALAQILEEPASYLAGIESDPKAEAVQRLYRKLDDRGKSTLYRVAESESAGYADGNMSNHG